MNKRFVLVLTILALIMGLALPVAASSNSAQNAAQNTGARVRLLDQLPRRLNVGESVTINIEVSSDTPFSGINVHGDPYCPAYIHDNGGDRAGSGTYQIVQITFTGARDSTDNFCQPDGTVPDAVVVGVRFPQGNVQVERFDFSVTIYP